MLINQHQCQYGKEKHTMRTPSKSLLIDKYIDDRIGQEFKPMDIANLLNCTVQTVYLYIRKNPSRFTTVSRGLFKINAAEKQLFLNSDSTI
jgi:hypothetical protein